jgi:hypothetical protein
VEKTIRLGSRDLVARGVKCGPHGGKNNKVKSVDSFLFEPQTKDEPRLRGSRVMSGDRRRLHQVPGVCSGSPENHFFTRLSHKAEAEDRVWLSGQNRSDRFVKLVRPVWGHRVSGSFEAVDTRRDRRDCVEAKRSAVTGHPSDGVTTTTSQSALGGHVS